MSWHDRGGWRGREGSHGNTPPLPQLFVLSMSCPCSTLWAGRECTALGAGGRRAIGTRPRVVAYVRVSTEKQAEQGLSLDAQQAKLTAYAALYELDLVAIEVDAGAGAKTLQRPALRRALGALKAGKAEALLVVKLDRLTRSVKDLGVLVETYFLAGKWSLLSVSKQIDPRTAAGRMVLNILAVVSQWERETIGERTAEAMAYKRRQREYTGGEPPYGWRPTASTLTPTLTNRQSSMRPWSSKPLASPYEKSAPASPPMDSCPAKAKPGTPRRCATCSRPRWHRWRHPSIWHASGRLKPAWPPICASTLSWRHGRRTSSPATRRSRPWRR
jgi:site-specific DNA recombinase